MSHLLHKGMRYPIFRILMTLVGAFIASIAINALYIPHNILSGGITGIAILLNLQLNFNTSLVILILNIPIFILGYRMIHRSFIVHSLIGMLALTFFITLTKNFSFHSDNMLTTILLGGVLSGIGYGLIFRSGGSTGGNDIISKMLNRKYSYSISTFNFAFNLLIIALSITTFGVDKSIETLTAMYVSSLVTKYILEGTNYKRTVFIITDKKDAVAEQINHELARGCTIIEGTGSYTLTQRHLLYAVISISQVTRLKDLVRQVDSSAFINVIETQAVFGNGFLDIKGD